MKRNLRLSLFPLLAATLCLTQGTTPSLPAPAAVVANKPAQEPEAANKPAALASAAKTSAASVKSSTPAANPSPDDLQGVLEQMDEAAGGFNSAQGEFEIKTYQKVVDDLYVQKGSISFRRTKRGGVDAAFQFTSPDDKQVVFKNGKLIMHERKINQITEWDVSKNKASVESFLSLGFGARSKDLLNDYDVKMGGWENIDGVKTAKLELVAKNEKLRNTYDKIVLWIDPARDIILQQKFFESVGNYRLAHYTNLKINGKLPAETFNIYMISHH